MEILGQHIQGDAKRYSPVATGRLRDSIDYIVVEDDGEFGVLYIFSDVDYSVFVELGTAKQGAQPYLRPALEQRRGVN